MLFLPFSLTADQTKCVLFPLSFERNHNWTLKPGTLEVGKNVSHKLQKNILSFPHPPNDLSKSAVAEVMSAYIRIKSWLVFTNIVNAKCLLQKEKKKKARERDKKYF